ncbi:hypothetical protein LTS12_021057 [Elasticomyces elasticus]|nr:hypothetical protein LTS12_021057 [Elasticomyces elasticus]
MHAGSRYSKAPARRIALLTTLRETTVLHLSQLPISKTEKNGTPYELDMSSAPLVLLKKYQRVALCPYRPTPQSAATIPANSIPSPADPTPYANSPELAVVALDAAALPEAAALDAPLDPASLALETALATEEEPEAGALDV